MSESHHWRSTRSQPVSALQSCVCTTGVCIFGQIISLERNNFCSRYIKEDGQLHWQLVSDSEHSHHLSLYLFWIVSVHLSVNLVIFQWDLKDSFSPDIFSLTRSTQNVLPTLPSPEKEEEVELGFVINIVVLKKAAWENFKRDFREARLFTAQHLLLTGAAQQRSCWERFEARSRGADLCNEAEDQKHIRYQTF